MNKSYLNLIFIILIIAMGLSFYFLARKDISFSEDDCKSILEELTNKNIVEISSNYELLDSHIELQDLNGNKIQLGNLISGNILVFRYSVLHCSSCVYENIQVLDSIYKSGIEGIIVIAHYDNLRNLLIDYKRNNYSLPIYILSENRLSSELDNLKVPQFILLDSELLINRVFIPGVSARLDELFLLSAVKFISH